MLRATALFLFLFFPLSVWGEVVDQVAALVEGEVITLSEVQQLVQYKGWQISEEPDERRSFYLTVLDQIINQKLISREAQQTPGNQISQDDITQQLQAYRRRFSSQDQFQEKLASMEMTESTLRDLIRRELSVWRFIQTRFEPFIIVMPAQIQKYYDEILVPELAQTGSPLPALELVREQIREILILEKTNQEMDRWVENLRSKAQVSVLLFRATPSSPNLPQELLTDWELQPITIRPTNR
ncbi:MAG: SurA N-terminal domain-containing protein [Nitrospirota bacterium]|nr:SurA N-terminal domain-containing protein [Nitrospirota bacterium]